MTVANISIIYSYPTPSPAQPQNKPKHRHGGARYTADRVSHEVTLKQALQLRAAWAFADWQGFTLNYWLTIHWGKMGVSDASAGRALKEFMTYVRDYLRKRGLPVLWLYVREHGVHKDEQGEAKGSHVHFLLYLPIEAAKGFHDLQEGWLEKATRRTFVKGAIKGESLPRHAKWNATPKEGEFATKQEAVQADSWNCLNYVMKGVHPRFAKELNLVLLQAGGAIIGKRVGVCKALQPKAMAEAGYTPPERHPMMAKPHKGRYR